MSQTVARPMSVDEFFAWQEKQDVRYELVNGQPLRMMAGASNAHDLVVVNLIRELSIRLRGSGCTPFTGDGSVETRPGQIRRPDVGIDCGNRDPNGYRASEPRVVFEVLSRSTKAFDTVRKLDEYRGVDSISAVVMIDPTKPGVAVLLRTDCGWKDIELTRLDDVLVLTEPSIELPLSAIYEDLTFPPVRLAEDDS